MEPQTSYRRYTLVMNPQTAIALTADKYHTGSFTDLNPGTFRIKIDDSIMTTATGEIKYRLPFGAFVFEKFTQ